MDEFLSKPSVQGLGLFVVAALLSIPLVGKALKFAFPALSPQGEQPDFAKQTVVELMTLKEKLEQKGPPHAAKLCKDLIVALVTGEQTQKQ
jgi:hypothetical protein